MSVIGSFIDRMLGRGAASVTVPVLDGPFLPNQALEDATIVARLAAPDNLVATGDGAMLLSSGNRLLRLASLEIGTLETVADLPHAITALAAQGEALAIGLEGNGVLIRGGPFDGRGFRDAGGRVLSAPTAIAWLGPETLVVCNGGEGRLTTDWRRDLMEKGESGSLWRIDLDKGSISRLADGLAWPNGVAAGAAGQVYVSESWAHRVLSVDLSNGRATPVLAGLPAYPARIVPAAGGGYWFTFLTVRNQLVEFILQEPAYLRRMLAEVPEPFWMAPSLSSGSSFKEPMQGSQLKQMGVAKPYAASRSYGLVVRCNAQMQPLYGYHSRADGTTHGTVSACDAFGGQLIVASRGNDKLVRIDEAASAAGGVRS